MQIKLVIENIEEEQILRDLNICAKGSAVICLKSISSWIVEDYYTNQIINKSRQTDHFIGLYDMFVIYQRIQSSSLDEFFELCKNKLKQMKNNVVLENYNNYLRRCSFVDIIDLFQQCQLETVVHTMILSIDNIKNDIDRLFFEYLLQSASSCGVYAVKSKLTTTETKENVLKLIVDKAKFVEQMNYKNSMKYTLCTYLSLLSNARNDHALLHCLITSTRVGNERDAILEFHRLMKLSKDKDLTMHQVLHSFVRRKESKSNPVSSLPQDIELFPILDKYYTDIKEFFDLIEQLQMIIKENESIVSFRDLLQLISNQLCKNISFNQYDLIMNEIIEDFQSTLSMINCTSPIQSASCDATLAGRHFSQSIAYLCAKQTIDLPVLTTNYDRLMILSSVVLGQVTKQPAEEKAVDLSMKSKTKENDHNERCLDLSTIHEASFESDSIEPSNNKTQSQLPAKRQPLREIDVNSFNNEDRQIENEKNPTGFILISDGDKENFPTITNKRSMISGTTEQPSKKQKMATNKFIE